MTGLILAPKLKSVTNSTVEDENGVSWLKQGFYLVISILLTVGIFFLDKEASLSVDSINAQPQTAFLMVEGNNRVDLYRTNAEVGERFTNKIELKAGDRIKTNASSNVTLFFTSDALMRLDENTEILVNTLDENGKMFDIEAVSGQMWVNNLYNSARITISADGLKIRPQEALLNIYRIDQRVDIHVHRHQVELSLYDAQGIFLNNLFVSEGNKVTVGLQKLDTILSKLYYSKLVKEFQYSLFDQKTVTSDPWVKENLAKDAKHDTEVRTRERDAIKSAGLKNASIDTVSYELNRFLSNNIKSPLTVIPDKKKDFYINDLFVHIDDAIYLAEAGRLEEATQRLDYFDLTKNDDFYLKNITSDSFKQALEKRIHKLVFVLPNEDIYLVKQYLLNQRLALKDSDSASYFEFLSYYLDDVYDASRLNYSKATVILENYFKVANAFLASNQSQNSEYVKSLQVQNHFLDNLLLRYPVFYKREILLAKAKMEKTFLAGLPAGELKNEENQAIISKKIELLKRLQYFFFNDQVQLDVASSVVGTLITNIEDLLPPDASKLAVQEFFKKSLGDFNLFWGFLNNNEFAATNTYGTSNQARYDAYVLSQDENASLIDLANALFTNKNNEVVAIPKEEIIRQVKKDLTEAGFKSISFSNDILDGDQMIKIKSASYLGFTISGVYDRERSLFSDIYVGGNLLSKSAVKLKNLELLVNDKFGDIKDNLPDTSIPGSSSTTTKSEKLLISLFVNQLAGYKIILDNDDVEILDKDTGTFHVIGLPLPGAAEALYSFDVLQASDTATNIYIITLRHQIKLKEDVALSDLESAIKAAYQEYLTEIGKTDALESSAVDEKPKVPKRPVVKSSNP